MAAAAGVTGLIALLAVVDAGPASADPGNPGGFGTPAVAVGDQPDVAGYFELSPAHHVMAMGSAETDLGGFAVDGLAATLGAGAVPSMVLVRGRDNAVWYRESADSGATWSRWLSLGGQVTAHPAVMEAGGTVVVAAVGANGRMYERVRTATGWSPRWLAVNATFTGALALGRGGTGFVVYGRGGDGRLWTATRGADPAAAWSAFSAVPTRSALLLADPAVDPNGGALYVRGMDGACWMFDPAQPAMGWRSLGGRFESGFTALTSEGDSRAQIVGRGLNHRLYTGINISDTQWSLLALL